MHLQDTKEAAHALYMQVREIIQQVLKKANRTQVCSYALFPSVHSVVTERYISLTHKMLCVAHKTQVLRYKICVSPDLFDAWYKGRDKKVSITVKIHMYLIDIQNHKKVIIGWHVIIEGRSSPSHESAGHPTMRIPCKPGARKN
jgi:hypothetical protein